MQIGKLDRRIVIGAVAAVLIALVVLAYAYLGRGGGDNVNPTPTPFTTIIEITPTPSPGNATPTPGPNVTATPVPTPVCPANCTFGCLPGTAACAPPRCPSNCLFGCEPGTTRCREPVCPPTCLYGCEPGTSACKVVVINLSMVNPDFETGNYLGWNRTGGAWGGAPKNGNLMNSQHLYYSIPYSGWQGTYFASTYPERTAIGTLHSSQFTINRRYLEFLAIGQADARMCVGLTIEDGTVYEDCDALEASSVKFLTPSQPTVNSYSVFKRIVWDVSTYKGRQAYIEAIDNSARSWMEVDDFRQTDIPSAPPTQPENASGYQCNRNGLCEPGLSEYEYRCQADCPPPSSCRFAASQGGRVDFTIYCHSFRLMPSGLFLYLRNTGTGRNQSVTVKGIKCTQETAPDPATYAPLDIPLAVGDIGLVSNGTLPCYDSNNTLLRLKENNTFVGRLYVMYEDADTLSNYERLNFDAVVMPNLK